MINKIVSITMWVGLLLCGCAINPPCHQARPPATIDSLTPLVGVVDEGWHTGLILPIADIQGPLSALRPWFPHARFLIIGFGNRSYYIDTHPGIFTGLRALFPSPGVLYIQAVRSRSDLTAQFPTQIYWGYLSRTGLHHLRDYLARSLNYNAKGTLQPLPTGHTRSGRFFASPLTYDALHTCNTWTMATLQAGGLPVHQSGIIFADQVEAALRTRSVCRVSVNAATALSRKLPQ